MFTHISMFVLKPEDKEANMQNMLVELKKVPEKEPSIRTCTVGAAPHAPQLPQGVGPVFCDIAQILTFDTPEDAMAYPASQAHMDLAKATDSFVANVFAIDFPIEQ